MEGYERIIYGIVEPYEKGIVYINSIVKDVDDVEYDNEDYIEAAIDSMMEDKNIYVNDLMNMYHYNIDHNKFNKVLTNAVVLERFLEKDKKDVVAYTEDRTYYWRDIFKPRYNVNEMKHKLPPYMTIKPEDIVPSFHVDEDNIALYTSKCSIEEKHTY